MVVRAFNYYEDVFVTVFWLSLFFYCILPIQPWLLLALSFFILWPLTNLCLCIRVPSTQGVNNLFNISSIFSSSSVSLCSLGWLRILYRTDWSWTRGDCPTVTYWVWRSQVYTTVLALYYSLEKLHVFIFVRLCVEVGGKLVRILPRVSWMRGT